RGGATQYQDAERGVAEAEALGLPLCVHADHRVDLFGVAVDPAQGLRVLRGVAHLLEGLELLQVQQPAELVVAGNAALTDPDDVDRGEVDAAAVRPVEVLQEAREVVKRARPWMARPERA